MRRPPRDGRARSYRVRGLLALGLVAALGATGTTYAAWTDSASVDGTTMSAGTLDITATGTSGTTLGLDLAAMVPGASAAAPVTVHNAGTAPLTWTAVSVVDNPTLGAQLGFVVTSGAVRGTRPTQTCDGTQVASGGSLGGVLVGTPTRLAPGASTTLCVQVTLSTTAPSSLQGASTTVSLRFDGASVLP